MEKLFLLVLLSLPLVSVSQNLDLIVTESGDSIACKIDSVSVSQVFVQVKTTGSRKWVQTVYDLNKIVEFEYAVIDEHFYFEKGTSRIAGIKTKYQYKDIKQIYDHRDYQKSPSDCYDPTLAGFMSLVPGLGLCYAGEPLRSLAYVGGMVGSFFGMGVGFGLAWGGSNFGVGLFLAGAGGIAFFYIASMVSAVKVAKVKNMAFQNRRISMKIQPKFELKNQYTPCDNFGLTLKLSF